MRRLLLLLLILGSCLNAATGIWHPHLEVEGRAGDFRRGGGVQLFAPLAQSGQTLLFGQALGGYFLDEWVGSAGVGLRHAISRCWGAGANIFVDVARSQTDRTYLQLGVGGEIFGPCWVIRGNAYLSDGHPFREETTIAELDEPNGILAVDRTFWETALHGGDAEAGYGLCVGKDEVWLFAGGYYYDGQNFESRGGPRIRAEYRWKDPCRWEGVQVTVEGEYQWDRADRSQGSATVRVRMPLGRMPRRRRCCDMSVCQRMGESVRRERAIWVRDETRALPTFIAEPPIFFVSGNGNGLGRSQASPTNIEDVQSLATDEGAAIILLSTGDNIVLPNGNAPYPLLQGQMLAGFDGQASITVRVVGRDVVIKNANPSSGPAVLTTAVPDGDDLLSAAGGNELVGFHLLDGERAIVATNTSDLNIHDLTIISPNALAIDVAGSEKVTIENVTILADPPLELSRRTTATTTGLLLDGVKDLMLDSMTVTGVETTAVELTNATGTVAFKNCTFSADAGPIFAVTGGSPTLTLDNTTIRSKSGSAPSAGLQISDCNGTVTATNSTLTMNTGGRNVEVSGGNPTVKLDGLAITGARASISSLKVTDGTVSFGPSSIAGSTVGVGEDAIELTGGSVSFKDLSVATDGCALNASNLSHLTMTGTNSLTSTGDTALFLDTIESANVTIAKVESENSAASGVEISQVGGGVHIVHLGVKTPAGDGLKIVDSSAACTVAAEIQEAGAHGIYLDGNTGNIKLPATFVAKSTGDGLHIEKMEADVQLGPEGGILGSNTGGSASGEINVVDLAKGELYLVGKPLILGDSANSGTVLKVRKSTGAEGAIRLQDLTVQGGTSTGAGIDIEGAATADLLLSLTNVMVQSLNDTPLRFMGTGTGGDFVVLAKNVTIADVKGQTAIGLDGASGARFTLAGTNLTFEGGQDEANGLLLSFKNSGGAPNTVLTDCQACSFTGIGASLSDSNIEIVSDSSGAADHLNVQFDDLMITDTFANGLTSHFEPGSGSDLNLMIFSTTYGSNNGGLAFNLMGGDTTGRLTANLSINRSLAASSLPESLVINSPSGSTVDVVSFEGATKEQIEAQLKVENTLPGGVALTGSGFFVGVSTSTE